MQFLKILSIVAPIVQQIPVIASTATNYIQGGASKPEAIGLALLAVAMPKINTLQPGLIQNATEVVQSYGAIKNLVSAMNASVVVPDRSGANYQ